MEEQMNMVELLSEELGEKELKIMSLEKELEKLKDIIEYAINVDLVYECPQCKYLTDNRMKKYVDKKYPDENAFRCRDCRDDDSSSEED